MLTLPYLKTVLRYKLFDLVDVDKQIIESAGGYDGIVSLLQTKGASPMIVLEHSEVGEFNINPGGFVKTSQSIWVMKMVGRDDNRREVQDECFSMMQNIIKIFIRHHTDEYLDQWEWNSIPWGVRNAGANFTGYEFTMYFSEDFCLEAHNG